MHLIEPPETSDLPPRWTAGVTLRFLAIMGRPAAKCTLQPEFIAVSGEATCVGRAR
ncbi:hypothetical protein [Polaromonas sp.]|uniref:hypothetical protein n=1 Tax=Polaromonas sp. TaxID=1869339 RepID=UPI0032641ED1